MNAWMLAWLIHYLRKEKRWSWAKIGRKAAVGIGYLAVGRFLACFLPRV